VISPACRRPDDSATGKRLRDLPFTSDRVKAVLQSSIQARPRQRAFVGERVRSI
jgi:hypothetical protein